MKKTLGGYGEIGERNKEGRQELLEEKERKKSTMTIVESYSVRETGNVCLKESNEAGEWKT